MRKKWTFSTFKLVFFFLIHFDDVFSSWALNSMRFLSFSSTSSQKASNSEINPLLAGKSKSFNNVPFVHIFDSRNNNKKTRTLFISFKTNASRVMCVKNLKSKNIAVRMCWNGSDDIQIMIDTHTISGRHSAKNELFSCLNVLSEFRIYEQANGDASERDEKFEFIAIILAFKIAGSNTSAAWCTVFCVVPWPSCSMQCCVVSVCRCARFWLNAQKHCRK